MWPLTPTHALALARSEELRRLADGAHLAAAAPARRGRIAATLLTVAHDAGREIAATAKALTAKTLTARTSAQRGASASPAPCCA